MADTLALKGKIAAMAGIGDEIYQTALYSTSDTLIDTTAGDITDTYTADGTTGQLRNFAAIDFTIAAGDVGQTASYVLIQNVSGDTLLRIDLETTVLLTTAGTATIAINDLTADL